MISTTWRPLWRAGVRAAVLRPFPRPVHIDTHAPQHLAVVLGVVLRAIAEKLPVWIERLDPCVGGIAVDHQAARVGMSQRRIQKAGPGTRAQPGGQGTVVDSQRSIGADAQRYGADAVAV